MTQQKNPDRGGSTVVTDSGVEHKGGTLNPGDTGYADAVKKVAVHNDKQPGTFNRSPSYRDLDEQGAIDRERAKKPKASTPTPPATSGGKQQ